MIEVEIKLPIKDKSQLKTNLIALGFEKGKIVRESDIYFNSENYDLRERDSALRIRTCKDIQNNNMVTAVTYKGPKLDHVSMTRKEIETEISDAKAFLEIFKGMGFYPLSPVQKLRQYYHLGDMIACVDSVERLGDFLELEVLTFKEEEKELALQQIKEVLEKLGHDISETIRTSYLSMLQKKEVQIHYDLLVEEDNDPVRDPKPMQEYMDKWDGPEFINKLYLDKKKSVLELGVGTGRLAMKTAPYCGTFCGIDISEKTIQRAEENLKEYEHVSLICADFLTYEFEQKFDAIYSSLTFMHIKDKQSVINKVEKLLNDNGVFVLSIDKSQEEWIEFGERRVRIYPDKPEIIEQCILKSGLILKEEFETEFATIFVARKRG